MVVRRGLVNDRSCFQTGHSAYAHLQTLKTHVKLASMESFCDCIGYLSRS
jgi:hypothetical protein